MVNNEDFVADLISGANSLEDARDKHNAIQVC